jgi:DNA polymerase III epsilon subunit-like protein
MDSKAKILLIDIETCPNISAIWGNYEQDALWVEVPWQIISFSAKWLRGRQITKCLIDYKGKTDKELVKDIWKLLDEADMAIGHNCVEENTLVLNTDLKWIKAGSLKIGDKIVGFEENGKKNQARHIQESIVEYNAIKEAECYKVILNNGEELITTPEHKWLKLAPNGREYRWCETKNLKIGQRVNKFIEPWEEDNTYESGWLSGFISGEGTLKKSNNKAIGSIDFCQRPGITLKQAIDYCSKLDINISNEHTKIGGLGKGDTIYHYTIGGKWKTMSILGRLQIRRLIDKINWNTCGSLKGNNTITNTIIGIEYVGRRKVAVLQTSTKTFIAGGYAMHNCNAFDFKKINTRFIANGMPPVSPFKPIDTLKIARRYFAFNSNKLDDLGEFLGLGRKLHHEGKELWRKCMAGDEKAWRVMRRYNKQDVILLEKVYLELLPWMKEHPNLGMYNDELVCPKCGSDDIQMRGYAMNQTTKYRRFMCNNCGGWGRVTIGEKVNKPIVST